MTREEVAENVDDLIPQQLPLLYDLEPIAEKPAPVELIDVSVECNTYTISLDIPVLDSTLQAEVVKNLVKWGSIGRTLPIQGTVHFYTDDDKFRGLDKNAGQILDCGCTDFIEVNHSQKLAMSRALVIADIFRKRCLARYWQTFGKRIWVDLNIESKFFDIALLGVPEGWKSYANRGMRWDKGHLYEAYDLARQHGGADIRYIVYGGGREIQAICEKYKWPWFYEDADLKHGRVAHG